MKLNMPGDFSRISFDEFKHYAGVLLQQGKVQVDADWNEQTLILNDILGKITTDVFGSFYCISNSFRIGRGIILDSMNNPKVWKLVGSDDKQGSISFTTLHKPQEIKNSKSIRGSLLISKSQQISKEFDLLDLSRFQNLLLRIKFESGESFSIDSTKGDKVTVSLHRKTLDKDIIYTWSSATLEYIDEGGFSLIKFPLNIESCEVESVENVTDFDLSQIYKITVRWSNKNPICLGPMELEPLLPIVSADPNLPSNFWINVNDESKSFSDFTTIYNGKPSILKHDGFDEIKWDFPTIRNFYSINKLYFSSKKYFKPLINLITFDNEIVTIEATELMPQKTTSFELHHYVCDIKNARNDPTNDKINFKKIKSIQFINMPSEEINISEIRGEINQENDFVIGGNNLDATKPGRMYVGGILCQKEFNETYQSQLDYPNPKPLSLNDSEISTPPKKINYIVYVDVWQRLVSHIEDPEIRESALGGPDTAIRIKTLSQIKLREIPDIDNFENQLEWVQEELKRLSHQNDVGRMSTVTHKLPSENFSKIEYTGLDNRLYLVQIHDSGDKKENPASFKWSIDNASSVIAIKEIGPYGVTLKSMGKNLMSVLKMGDLVEITDDSIELSDLPKGNLRRITNIDLDSQLISWESDDADPTGIEYLHDAIDLMNIPEYHPKIIKWDGIKKINSNDDGSGGILLSDDGPKKTVPDHEGVKINFTNGNFQCGDYWQFTVRTTNGIIENLSYARPHGTKQNLFPLGIIQQEEGKSIKILEDLRKNQIIKIL